MTTQYIKIAFGIAPVGEGSDYCRSETVEEFHLIPSQSHLLDWNQDVQIDDAKIVIISFKNYFSDKLFRLKYKINFIRHNKMPLHIDNQTFHNIILYHLAFFYANNLYNWKNVCNFALTLTK